MSVYFNLECQQCPRLAQHLKQIRVTHPDYFAKPVPPFGDPHARLVIVGLAPGMHGANRTGRPFTGDHAGILLYETLYRFGFSTQAVAEHVDDGLILKNCRITNAVKCLPPENKPTTDEINMCNQYLAAELINAVPHDAVIVALGTVAHNAVLAGFKLKKSSYPFAHAAQHKLPSGQWLIDSYHCSRYNTQTRRLTTEMFHAVFATAKHLLD
ncbi:MAG: uracil-DNA glycosylase [Gammaproteobacteria bacterium]|nr:uracil-DNA glycosylase [Gammaproteobacteria bacterium]